MLRRTIVPRVQQTSKALIAAEAKFGAHNYSPLPVVFARARGVTVANPEGQVYMDFLSGYSAVNQGHLHPRLVQAVVKQLSRCTLSSRAFYNDKLSIFSEYVTKLFGYDKVLPMNTGAEGVETALKLARKWGYKKKKIPANQAKIVCCTGNFHGRTFGAIAMSNDPSSYENYGPHLPNILRVPYGDAAALQAVFEAHGKTIAGFIFEPIQGEAGVCIPPAGYIKKARALCTKHNILMIDDEVQAGLGRTGKMLAVEHEGVRPDVVILAKALGGGIMPVSCVLADAPIMDVIEPGTHGSTFGGNPVAAVLAVEALKVLKDEQLLENATKLGKLFGSFLDAMKAKYPFIAAVRCRGLFAAIEFHPAFLNGHGGYRMMHVMKELRVLCKVTHETTIRLTPPLVIKKDALEAAMRVIDRALWQLQFEHLSANINSAKPAAPATPAGASKKKAAVKKAVAAKKAKVAPKKK